MRREQVVEGLASAAAEQNAAGVPAGSLSAQAETGSVGAPATLPPNQAQEPAVATPAKLSADPAAADGPASTATGSGGEGNTCTALGGQQEEPVAAEDVAGASMPNPEKVLVGDYPQAPAASVSQPRTQPAEPGQEQSGRAPELQREPGPACDAAAADGAASAQHVQQEEEQEVGASPAEQQQQQGQGQEREQEQQQEQKQEQLTVEDRVMAEMEALERHLSRSASLECSPRGNSAGAAADKLQSPPALPAWTELQAADAGCDLALVPPEELAEVAGQEVPPPQQEHDHGQVPAPDVDSVGELQQSVVVPVESVPAEAAPAGEPRLLRRTLEAMLRELGLAKTLAALHEEWCVTAREGGLSLRTP